MRICPFFSLLIVYIKIVDAVRFETKLYYLLRYWMNLILLYPERRVRIIATLRYGTPEKNNTQIWYKHTCHSPYILFLAIIFLCMNGGIFFTIFFCPHITRAWRHIGIAINRSIWLYLILSFARYKSLYFLSLFFLCLCNCITDYFC